MNQTPIYQVDAFASAPFQGNPAAVCLLDEDADAEWMQNLAVEMNLSETAFVVPHGDEYRLRWFTPEYEVELCGHATLASAHILWQTGALPSHQPATFDTLSGKLPCRKTGGWIEMDFPGIPASETKPPDGLLEALDTQAVYVGRNNMDYIVHVNDESIVKNMAPNFSELAKIDIRGTIVTALSNDGNCDFVSRFFAPRAGINEDPVTGSAHCCLAMYWGPKLGKESVVGYQASKRGGWVKMRLSQGRVVISGQAVTVLEGTLI